jgi:hypothetical protein
MDVMQMQRSEENECRRRETVQQWATPGVLVMVLGAPLYKHHATRPTWWEPEYQGLVRGGNLVPDV